MNWQPFLAHSGLRPTWLSLGNQISPPARYKRDLWIRCNALSLMHTRAEMDKGLTPKRRGYVLNPTAGFTQLVFAYNLCRLNATHDWECVCALPVGETHVYSGSMSELDPCNCIRMNQLSLKSNNLHLTTSCCPSCWLEIFLGNNLYWLKVTNRSGKHNTHLQCGLNAIVVRQQCFTKAVPAATGASKSQTAFSLHNLEDLELN